MSILLYKYKYYNIYSDITKERKDVIDTRNQLWIEADSKAPFVRAHMFNPAAEYLKQQQVVMPGMYGEIFLTNVYGVIVASTGKLTTLSHAHKYWWEEAYRGGQGRFFHRGGNVQDSSWLIKVWWRWSCLSWASFRLRIIARRSARASSKSSLITR